MTDMISRRWFPAVVVAAVVLLVDTARTYAWGPATHTQLALDVLSQASLLPATIAALLVRRTASFIFGSIAADVVFAKRMSRVRQFCHHWSTGFSILDRAESDNDRAFACGYLAHLAADTVAHNKYVPRQLSTTGTTLNFGHVYWEMRADALIVPETWRDMEHVLAADHEGHHRVLEEQLTATLLPYHLNRRLFDRMNFVVSRAYWRRCTAVWYRVSRWDLCDKMVSAYRAESVDRIIAVLERGSQSPVVREDPNGSEALRHARMSRRHHRSMRRRGVPIERRTSESVAALAPRHQTPELPSPVDAHPDEVGAAVRISACSPERS